MMLDLPQPLGPTTPTSWPGNRKLVGSANDLKPDSLIELRRTAVPVFMMHLDARQVRWQRTALRFVLRLWCLLDRAQRRELHCDRLQIGFDRLFEEAALHTAPGFAARGKLPALQHRHLMGELLDLQILVP